MRWMSWMRKVEGSRLGRDLRVLVFVRLQLAEPY